MSQPKDLIIDGNNLAFRAIYTPHPPLMVDGQDVSGIRQFVRMVLSYCKQFQPIGSVYIAWDKRISRETKNFRKLLEGSEYKQTRDHTKHEHVYEIMDKLPPIVAPLGVRNVFPWSLEGDDIMAWLARHHCGQSIIISSDNDLWQLISPTVSCFEPNRKSMITIDNFRDHCPVDIDKYVLYKCIVGDKSDHVKGLPKFGEVRGAALANDFERQEINADYMDIIDRNKKMLDLEYGLTQSDKDLDIFREQIKYHDLNTALDIDAFNRKCAEYGILDYTTTQNVQMIRKLFSYNEDLARMRSYLQL
jgi:DNA polymerase-1